MGKEEIRQSIQGYKVIFLLEKHKSNIFLLETEMYTNKLPESEPKLEAVW